MNGLASRLAALHSGLWAVDPWYQRSWFVAAPAIALVLAGWMLGEARMPANAPWAKPGTSAPSTPAAPPAKGGPASQQEQTCDNDNVEKAVGLAGCDQALANAVLTVVDWPSPAKGATVATGVAKAGETPQMSQPKHTTATDK